MMLGRKFPGLGKLQRAVLANRRLQSSVAPTIHQRIAGRRRFYKLVDVAPVDGSNGQVAGYKITLDGRSLKTPSGNALLLPNETLAFAIAAEWDAQEEDGKRGIQPPTMPLMILASTAIDQILPDPSHVRSTCLSYLPTDTALFLTGDDDRILLKKQRQHFQPVLRWLSRTLGLELKTTQSVSHRVAHPEATIKKVEAIVHSLDHFSLACLQCATMECKSVLLGLSYICRHLNLDQVRAASRLEEEFQVEIWGVVEGGHDMDRLNNSVSLSSSGMFMGLLWDAKKAEEHIAKFKSF